MADGDETRNICRSIHRIVVINLLNVVEQKFKYHRKVTSFAGGMSDITFSVAAAFASPRALPRIASSSSPRLSELLWLSDGEWLANREENARGKFRETAKLLSSV